MIKSHLNVRNMFTIAKTLSTKLGMRSAIVVDDAYDYHLLRTYFDKKGRCGDVRLFYPPMFMRGTTTPIVISKVSDERFNNEVYPTNLRYELRMHVRVI